MIHSYHRVTTAVALTLAMVAIVSPPALGDPQPLGRAESATANALTRAPASSFSCGDVCSGRGYGSVGVSTSLGSVRGRSVDSGVCGLWTGRCRL
jgi:hypothetical protein